MLPASFNRPAPVPAAMPTPLRDRSIFEIMWSHRLLLIVLGLLGFAAGVGVWKVVPPKYQASATVYVHRPPVSGNVNPFVSRGATAGAAPAQEAVLKSAAVLDAVLAEPGIGEGPVLSKQKDPQSYLEKKLRFSVADDKETLTLRFASTDPQEAADVVNAVVRNFVKAQSRRANMTLAEALAVDPEHTPHTEATLNTDADGTFGLNVGSREMMTRLAEQQLTRLSEEVIEATLALENAEARLAAARQNRQDFDALLQLAMDQNNNVQYDSSALTQIRQIEVALGVAQTRLSAAKQVLGPQHVMQRSYQANVHTLTDQLGEARADAAENLLQSFAQSRDQARARLDHLRQRTQAAQAAADHIAQLAIEVLSPAVPPRKPAGPKLVVFAAVGLILGLGLATFIGLVREVRRIADDFEAGAVDADDAPAGWAVTSMNAGALPAPHATGWDRPAPAVSDAPALLGVIPRIAATHRLVGPGYDRAADSLHQLRAVLQAIARQQDVATIAFVSPRRGTGRTSVTIGVASSLATAGTRVLAVDADLAGRIARKQVARAAARQTDAPQRPDGNLLGLAEQSGHFARDHQDDPPHHEHHEHEHANGHAGPLGIAGFLEGQPLQDCLKTAGNDRLAFLPASSAEDRHLGVFSDRKIVELIDQATPAFDLMLFDAGPIPGSLEAFTVASVVDGVVIVVEENQDMAEYQRTIQHLRVINAKVLGVVINKAAQADTPAPAPARNGDGHAPQPEPAHDDDAPDTHDSADFAAAGSGILAASIFTDRQAGYQEQDWELTAVNDLLPNDKDLDDIKTVPSKH